MPAESIVIPFGAGFHRGAAAAPVAAGALAELHCLLLSGAALTLQDTSEQVTSERNVMAQYLGYIFHF